MACVVVVRIWSDTSIYSGGSFNANLEITQVGEANGVSKKSRFVHLQVPFLLLVSRVVGVPKTKKSRYRKNVNFPLFGM